MKHENSVVAQNLMNKAQYLSQALKQAHEIIKVLEQENDRLQDVLTNLTSLNNKDLDPMLEAKDDQFCTV